MSLNEQQCTLVLQYEGELALAKESDFMQQLEQKDDNVKVRRGRGDRDAACIACTSNRDRQE